MASKLTRGPLFAEVHNVPDDYHFTAEELERIIAGDLFTPRQGAIMARELQERRKAAMDSEPVGEFYEDGPLNWYQISDGDRVPDSRRIPLFRHAQQPVDSEPVGYLFHNEYGAVLYSISDDATEGFSLIGPIYSVPQPAPVVPDERKSFESFMAERFGDSVDQRRAKNGDQGYMAWDMVVAWIVWQARAELAGNSPVIPDGSAVAALTGIPMIPDGYVMVPKEPTEEMIAAAMNCDDVLFNSDESFCVQFGNIYEAMLAAAPQEVK